MLEDYLKREQFPVLKDGKSISLRQVQIPPYNPLLMAQWHFSRVPLQQCITSAFKDFLYDLDEISSLSSHALFYLQRHLDEAIRPLISQSGAEFICAGIPGMGSLHFSRLKIEIKQGHRFSASIPDEEITSVYQVPASRDLTRGQRDMYRFTEQKKLDKVLDKFSIYSSCLGWAVQGSGIIQKVFLKNLIIAMDNMALDFYKSTYP